MLNKMQKESKHLVGHLQISVTSGWQLPSDPRYFYVNT